jgi:hypothetical protein
MLHLFYSNRHETLADALLEDLAAFPAHNGPWASQQVIVPSAALRAVSSSTSPRATASARTSSSRISRNGCGADRSRVDRARALAVRTGSARVALLPAVCAGCGRCAVVRVAAARGVPERVGRRDAL